MRYDRIAGFALLLAAGVSAAGCDSGPEAGEITFELRTPAGDDGAVSFTLTAGGSNTITSLSAACSGCRVFTSRVSDREVRGVVTGTLSAGPVLRALVSDRKDPGSYRATVMEVASRSFELRSTAAYSLEVQN